MQKESDTEVDLSNRLERVSHVPGIAKLVVAALLNVIFWSLTNPITGGPRVVVGALFLLFLLTYQAAALLVSRMTHWFNLGMAPLKIRVFAVLLAVGSVVVVGLKSLDQLGIADLALVALTELVAGFYIARRF